MRPKVIKFEELEEEPKKQSVRLTSHKCAIAGDYDGREHVELRKKRNGKITLKWAGHVPIKTKKSQKCDMGHSHDVVEDQAFIWNYAELSRKEAKLIADFLLGQ